MKKNHLWWTVLFLFSNVLKAQTIELVRDINTTEGSGGIYVSEAVSAGGLYFALAFDDINHLNLWRSDGTAAGTYILTELPDIIDYPPKNLTAAGNSAFFIALYDNHYWLFRSDGTKAGTYPLHPVYSSEYQKLDIFEYNGSVYFSAYDGTNRNMWRSDGTVAGTVKVKSFPSEEFFSTGPYDFFNFNGFMYFLIETGYGSNATHQLWKSDGTTAGTLPGPAFSYSFKPVILNGYMYYSDGKTLKKTDGNTITIIRDGFETIGNPVLAGSSFYFSAGQQYSDIELWKSNGTSAGTVRVKDIYAGTDKSASPQLLTNVNGTLFFTARTSVNGYDLWKSNGTEAGTVFVKDVDPAGEVNFESMFAIGNQAVFSTDYGSTLWKSNGTSAGTQKVVEFLTGDAANVSGTLFFTGNNTNGHQIYKSDLTTAGTVKVTSLFPPGSYPGGFADLNGVRYMAADDGINGRELWKTNGTAAGTVLVKDVTPGLTGSSPLSLRKVNGNLFFIANDKEIWKTDGTAAGTVLVKSLVFTSGDDHIEGLVDVNGVLYFGIVSYSGPLRLWKSDGTSLGTVLVKSFPSTSGFTPSVLNGQLFFPAWDGADSYELWKTDGTAAGTTIIKNQGDEESGNSLLRFGAQVLNGFLYYAIENSDGFYLVKSDGTTAGTVIVKNLYGWADAYVAGFTLAGGLLYFNAYEYSSDSQESLWRTDGTAAGTFKLASFDGHPDVGSYIYGGSYAGGLFYFVPFNNEDGDQLWASDGTPGGTRQVKEIGAVSDNPGVRRLATIGNILYFTTSDLVHGTELWQSDGTEEGTQMVQDFNINGSSEFYSVTNYNDILLLAANNGSAGMELYKFQPQPPASLRINSGGAAYAAFNRRRFSADQYFSGISRLSNAAAGDILNTTDDQLYKEQRLGSAFQYTIPVANGQVNVILHFAEIYWGVPEKGGPAGARKRMFHVDMEGRRKLTNYDIFTVAGGAMRAKTETFTVDVRDGILNIDFLSGAADNPIIAAIEVLPVMVITGPLADAYVRNTPYDDTNYGTAATLEVKTGTLPAYERGTYLKFSLAGISQIGTARLRLYGSNVQTSSNVGVSAYGVTDDSWTETGINRANAPSGLRGALGSVNVNNTAKYYEIDVTAFVKSQLEKDKTVSLFITNPASQNNQVVFNSRENTANPPQMVIETGTSPVAPAARTGSETDMITFSETEHKASGIYPNPARKRFTLYVSGRHKGKIDLQLVSLSGSTYQVRPPQPAVPASGMEVDVSRMQLPKGIYLMKIQSAALMETVKILLTD